MAADHNKRTPGLEIPRERTESGYYTRSLGSSNGETRFPWTLGSSDEPISPESYTSSVGDVFSPLGQDPSHFHFPSGLLDTFLGTPADEPSLDGPIHFSPFSAQARSPVSAIGSHLKSGKVFTFSPEKEREGGRVGSFALEAGPGPEKFQLSVGAKPFVPGSWSCAVSETGSVEELSPVEEEKRDRMVQGVADRLAALVCKSPVLLSEWRGLQYSQEYSKLSEEFSGILGKDVVPSAGDRLISRPPPSGFKRRYRTNKKDPGHCVFCRQVASWEAAKGGEVFDESKPAEWQNHRTKDPYGDVICPYLFQWVCRFCGATGKEAHTDRYCPVKQNQKFHRHQ